MINNLIEKNKVFIVAEIGNNHEGCFETANQLIEASYEAGVDAVKFQTFDPRYYVTSQQQERLKRLNKFKLDYEQFFKLYEKAKSLNLIFFSTPFDLKSASELNKFQKIFKIASGDNTFYPLIKKIAEFKKPTFISTGLSDLKNLEILKKFWIKHGELKYLSFLHCVASYPTPDNEANLVSIKLLKKHFPDLNIGYSDHTIGSKACIYAAILGASIIEKHFTLDKNFSEFHDHKISADPKEMKEIVMSIKNAKEFIGTPDKQVQNCELNSNAALRRSIASKTNLNKNSIITLDDITWVRPGDGIPPGNEDLIIGKKLKNNVKQGQILKLEDFI